MADILTIIQSLVDNECYDQALALIKKSGLKVEIQNGKLVDISNSTEAWLKRFITVNPAMLVLKDDVRKLAKESDEVLIIGPTGTGKELIARALHGDREGQFVAVNCAGIPETLMESILFGHVRGAFTDAKEPRNGLMVIAQHGTLFLDEIGELPLELQPKLLRAIQEHKITKLGGDKSEDISCRIVCATNLNLYESIKFRTDLLARISTFILYTLSLQNRPEDIIPIIKSLPDGEEFLAAVNPKAITTTFNVRSLQQQVRRWKVLGRI